MYTRLVLRGNWDVLNQCSKKNWWSVKLMAGSLLECCLAIGHFVVHVAQVTRAFYCTILPCFWSSALHECDSCSFCHVCRRLCHSVRFSAVKCACVSSRMSLTMVLTVWWLLDPFVRRNVLLQDERTLQWCPQNKLLQKLCPCKGEKYSDKLGDTFQRKGVQSRQCRFVTYDGIIFSESQRKEVYSTLMHNSGYSDRQSHCGLRHTSEVVHQGTWRSLKDTFGERFSVSATVKYCGALFPKCYSWDYVCGEAAAWFLGKFGCALCSLPVFGLAVSLEAATLGSSRLWSMSPNFHGFLQPSPLTRWRTLCDKATSCSCWCNSRMGADTRHLLSGALDDNKCDGVITQSGRLDGFNEGGARNRTQGCGIRFRDFDAWVGWEGSRSCLLRNILSPLFVMHLTTPFVSERWGVLVSWFHCKSWQASRKSLEMSVSIVPGFCDGRSNLRKHGIVSDASFCLHWKTLNAIREIILHDWSVCVSASRLVFHVQKCVICRDQVSKCCRRCNPIHALLWFLFYTWFEVFLSSYETYKWSLSDNEWTHCGFLLVGKPMIPFLLLISFARVSPPALVTTDESFASRDCSSTTSFARSPPAVGVGVKEECISFFQILLKMVSADPAWCPPLLVLAESFPLDVGNSIDGTAFCLVTATMGTKIFDVTFDYSLTFW